MPVGQPASNTWTTYGGNLYNQRYSSLNQINTSNVKNLKGAWTFHTGIASAGTSFESSPVVVNGVMYLTGPHSEVWALNAKTGQQLWAYEPNIANIEALPLCCGQDNRGVAVGDGKVFVGQLDAKLTALDQKTGKVVWSVQVDDPRAGYTETMAPLYYNGQVFMGISGAEYEIHDYVTAYDAATGKQNWRFFTIPGPGEPGHNTWPANNDSWKYGGGSVWQTPALDPQLGMLYVTVGNPSPDLDGSSRAGDNLYTDSIIALDIKSGQLKWHYQEIHHDIWDYDTVSPPILFDSRAGGKQVKGLAEAGKTGWVYILDRQTGKPLVPINDKAVPQESKQNTAGTQPFPTGDSFVPLSCPEKIGDYPMGGIYTPFEQTPVLICPGANGGSEWSPISYDPQTNYVYTCGIHQPQIWTAKPEKVQPGTLRLGSAFVSPPGAKTWGYLAAINTANNKKAWDNQLDQMCIGGSTATAGGLVFAGEGNGNFDAFDAKSGQRLWQFQTGAGVNAPAVTYEVDGMQYVAVSSGGNFQLDFPRGDTLWVFSLNGNQGPVAAPPPPSSTVQPSAIAVNHVNIVDFAFGLATIEVPPGTTVTWTNQGPTAHTATSDNGVWDSGLLQKGQSFSYTFNTPGTYDYFCVPHPFMRGRVIVSPDAPPPTASPPPPSERGPTGTQIPQYPASPSPSPASPS
jgi:alcohol dehydrogenase (cytochrome c)